jgi:co-chaperonin GroES (HSP10)
MDSIPVVPTSFLAGIDPESLPVKPIGYRVLIKQVKAKDVKNGELVSDGGIIYGDKQEADRVQYDQDVGQVVAMGPECFTQNASQWYQLGDYVMFVSNNGKQVTDSNLVGEDEEARYHLMNDIDPMGVVPPGRVNND